MTSIGHTVSLARERWPGITIDDAALAELLGGSEPPPFAADVVLAQACIAGDPVAIRCFDREMFERVDRVLSRLRLSAADADDIKQDVRAKLLLGGPGSAKLSRYNGTGPLAQWVASVAGREALASLRKRKPVDEIVEDDLLDPGDDPHLVALKSRHSSDFKAAFQAAVAELPARDRAVLRAMIVDDRTVNEIASVYGIHRVTASRWISDIRFTLLRGTRARLREQLALDDAGLDSALRIIDTNLEVSLYRLLGDAA